MHFFATPEALVSISSPTAMDSSVVCVLTRLKRGVKGEREAIECMKELTCRKNEGRNDRTRKYEYVRKGSNEPKQLNWPIASCMPSFSYSYTEERKKLFSQTRST